MSGGIVDNSTILKVQNVDQEFSVGGEPLPVLRDVNFTLQANSFNIVFGPSGSGKSTLLNILAGLQPPSSGKLLIQDRDIYAMPSDELALFRANRIGFVHQTNHWIRSLNVIENISVPLCFLGYSRSKAVKLAKIALDRVNMGSYAKKQPLLLSGGEQQRLGAARALANDPLIVIADEPTGNLDIKNGDMIMDLLINAQTEFRRTVVLVTHNMEYVALADRLLKIQDGVIETIDSNDIQKVSKLLLTETKGRIKHLSEVKKNASKIG